MRHALILGTLAYAQVSRHGRVAVTPENGLYPNTPRNYHYVYVPGGLGYGRYAMYYRLMGPSLPCPSG